MVLKYVTQVVTIGVDIVVVGQYPTGGPRATFQSWAIWRWHRIQIVAVEEHPLDPSGAYTIVEIDVVLEKVMYFVQDVSLLFCIICKPQTDTAEETLGFVWLTDPMYVQ